MKRNNLLMALAFIAVLTFGVLICLRKNHITHLHPVRDSIIFDTLHSKIPDKI